MPRTDPVDGKTANEDGVSDGEISDAAASPEDEDEETSTSTSDY